MRTSDSIEQLRSELSQDLRFVETNYAKNREMTDRIAASEDADEFDYAALGYTLHNLYNSLESYFARIAKFFENSLDDRDWHRSLAERMTLEIEGVRPALFDLDFSFRVDELRRFRHLFRNLYKTPLIPQKVLFANRAADGIATDFRKRHEQFDRFLRELKAQILK